MHTLARFLQAQNAALNPAALPGHLDECERRLGVTLPLDLRAFLTCANGTAAGFGQWDWWFWRHEKLERVARLYTKLRTDNVNVQGRGEVDIGGYLGFADVLIWAPLYIVCADSMSPHFGEVLAVQGDSAPLYVQLCCASFARFAELFEMNHDEIILEEAEQCAPPNRA